MKTHETRSCKTAVVKNRKYYTMQVVLYACVGTMAFFANEIISLFNRFLTEMFDGEMVGTAQLIAKLIYLILHVLVLVSVETFFRRRVLDYKTVEE